MKLYGFPGTRSNRVRWMLEEVGEPYEFVHVEVTKGEHKTPEHLELHPHGRVPVFEDGSLRLIESCAIVLYLADKFPEKKLAPRLGTHERGRDYQWVVYASSMLDDAVIAMYLHSVLLPPERRRPEVVEQHRPTWDAAAEHVERFLEHRAYVVDDHFSAADVAIGYPLLLAQKMGLLDHHPRMLAYMARAAERPAFQRVFSP